MLTPFQVLLFSVYTLLVYVTLKCKQPDDSNILHVTSNYLKNIDLFRILNNIPLIDQYFCINAKMHLRGRLFETVLDL